MDDIESESQNTLAEILLPFASTKHATKPSLSLPSMLRSVHIPYILNGELYEIQTQEGENVTVKCCHCPPDRVYRGSVRSTGNFHMHIKRRHPDLLGKLHDMKVNALLERRDRLMKNRKLTYRSFNKSSSSTVKREPKYDQDTPTVLPPPPKLSLMHTHKFKIRAAYQQHQLQKQAQAQQQEQQQKNQHQQVMSNWEIVTPFVVVSNDVEPLNYSTKEQNMQTGMQTPEYVQNPSKFHSQSPAQQASTFENNRLLCGKSVLQTAALETTSHLNGESFYEMVTAPNTPCPSSVISYGSNTSINSLPNHATNPFLVIKNEHLFSEQALDLSSSSKQDSSIPSGIGSTAAETLKRGKDADSFASDATNQTTAKTNFKWDELFLHVESSLQNIQRVIQTRNQIETNRICLDIAKFKYLHPDFDFNYY